MTQWLILAAAAVLLIAVSYGVGAKFSFGGKEKPERVIGSRVLLYEFDQLGDKPPSEAQGVIEAYQNESYRIRFDPPLTINERTETSALLTARHARYPVSKVGRFGVLAVAGILESGGAFICNIKRA